MRTFGYMQDKVRVKLHTERASAADAIAHARAEAMSDLDALQKELHGAFRRLDETGSTAPHPMPVSEPDAPSGDRVGASSSGSSVADRQRLRR